MLTRSRSTAVKLLRQPRLAQRRRSSASCHVRRASTTAGETASDVQSLWRTALSGGDARSVSRHTHGHGKLLVRERIKLLLDADSAFFEIGLLAGHQQKHPCAGVVAGVGLVHGKALMVIAHDATVKGGSLYPLGVRKTLRCQQMAEQLRIPVVYLVDSAGAFLPLQAELFPDVDGGGRIFYNEARIAAGGLEQVAIVCGSCTAGGAYLPTMTSHAVIVDRVGSLFLGGPPLVRAALGHTVDAEQLGGARLHCTQSGCADYFAETEPDAFRTARLIISSLPPVGRLYGASVAPLAVGASIERAADTRQLVARVLDEGSLCEFRQLYSSGSVCGMGKIAGMRVGVFAATGAAGGLRRADAEKAAQFVQMCDRRSLPLVCLQVSASDTSRAFDSQDLKAHALLLAVLACAKMPKIAMAIGTVKQVDNYLMCGRSFDPVFHFMWPQSSLHFSETEHVSALDAANELSSDSIVLPEDTRTQVITCLSLLPQSTGHQSFTHSCLRF